MDAESTTHLTEAADNERSGRMAAPLAGNSLVCDRSVVQSPAMASVSDVVVARVRELVSARGPAALDVDDLQVGDLTRLEWSGSPSHVKSVGLALERRAREEVDYLATRAPTGEPIAKGGVDHADPHGPGKLWQLATHPALRSLGIGTALIAALEQRVRQRGLTSAWLGVETDNPRARALYERLGYEAFAREIDGWEVEREDGSTAWYETELVLMRRNL